MKEILYASYDGRVHAFWAGDKTEHGAWPFDVNLGATTLRFASEPVVADLDGDGSRGSRLQHLDRARQQPGRRSLHRRCSRASRSRTSRCRVPRQDWDGALGAPTLANLDGDPNVEVAVGTTNNGLVAYEIPGSRADRLRWPTGRGNLLRTAPEPGDAATALTALGALAAVARRRCRA